MINFKCSVHSDFENVRILIHRCEIGWDTWERVKGSIYLTLSFSKKLYIFLKMFKYVFKTDQIECYWKSCSIPSNIKDYS